MSPFDFYKILCYNKIEGESVMQNLKQLDDILLSQKVEDLISLLLQLQQRKQR